MRHIFIGCVVSAAALAATPSLASVQLKRDSEPVIKVISTDGDSYDSLEGKGQPLKFTMSGKCSDGREMTMAYISNNAWVDAAGVAKFFYIDMSNKPTAQSPELPPTAVGLPDGIYPGGVDYPLAWRKTAIDACNANLQQKRQYFGQEKNEVLAKSWELKGVKLGSVQGVIACKTKDKPIQFSDPPTDATNVYALATVKCERYSVVNDLKPNRPPPPTGADKFKLNVGVNQASLVMVPATYQGACPAQLHASATIVTNGVTDVKYRFESDKGELSPIKTIHVDQTHTAFVSVPITIGQPKSPGGFAAAPTQGGGAPNAFQSAQAPANVHQGFYRLKIVTPNSLESSPANFKVTCTTTKTGSNDLSATGVASPKPAVLKPTRSPQTYQPLPPSQPLPPRQPLSPVVEQVKPAIKAPSPDDKSKQNTYAPPTLRKKQDK